MSRMQDIMERLGPYEDPDPTPMAIPAHARVPLTLEQQMVRFFRSQQVLSDLEREGIETPEEADDFEISDDTDLDFGDTRYQFEEMESEAYPSAEIAPEGASEGHPADSTEPPGDQAAEPPAGEVTTEPEE